MISREAIYSALYEQLKTIKGFRTVGRRAKLWNELEPGQLPALFVAQGAQEARQQGGVPTVWILEADLLVYTYQADEQATPMPQMNDLLDAIESQLVPDDAISNRTTLGGLVSHVWIEGTVEIYEGMLGSYTVAIIPLRILAN